MPAIRPSSAATVRISGGRGCSGVSAATAGLTIVGISSPLSLREFTNAWAAVRAVIAAPHGSVSWPTISRMPALAPVCVLTVPGSVRLISFSAASRFSCDLATAA